MPAGPVDMTRAAVEEGFERFVGDTVEATFEEFSVVNALRGGSGPPGVTERLVKNNELLERTVVRPELRAYRDRVLAQFGASLDAYAADEPFEAHRDSVLAEDAYAEALRRDLSRARREEIRDALVERQRELAAAVQPLVESDEEGFWAAVGLVLLLLAPWLLTGRGGLERPGFYAVAASVCRRAGR